MQVILLERIGRLGQMGDVVTVKDGFARNFLLPQGKALRATKANRERFEKERSQLEARNPMLGGTIRDQSRWPMFEQSESTCRFSPSSASTSTPSRPPISA
jgi:hypothetical protein